MLQYERLECEYLRKFFSYFQVDCVFDVGANSGQYARVLREGVGFTGQIISFEPIPEIAAVLRGKASSDPKWEVIELALDEAVRQTVFLIMANNQFSSLKSPRHSEVERFRDMNKVTAEVPLTTSTLTVEFPKLQAMFGFSNPFLKMDTQGNDLAVVEGAGDFIREFVGLQSELSIKRIYEDTHYFDEVLRQYVAKGFALSALVPNNEGHFPDLIEIDCIMYRTRRN